jgi:ring-1,2-phenylacetyl-CoA epoxidase subunit PaaD
VTAGTAGGERRLREALSVVRDPEIRVLSIEELGILRSVRFEPDGWPVITITPTYVGCPAMEVIRADIRSAARAAGYPEVRIETVWSPAWTTRWVGEPARAKLKAAGIAPPVERRGVPGGVTAPAGTPLLSLAVAAPPCPRCGSADTTELTRFGSTACKALWRCTTCSEPFDHLKEH